MTSAPLVANDLDAQLPELLAGATVVAVVPATDLRGWAAETAWRVARAAALGGRRTALVDCFVDAPTLHTVKGTQNDEGINDVFEYGASLNRIVQAQPQANLFFVPAGTYAADAQPLVAHPRWKRLSAGFRHEEALLLLYVSPEHLATLAAEPDGMIVLSPIGLETTVAEAPGVAEALARGLKLLAVVADPDSIRMSGAHKAIDEGSGDARDRRPAAVTSGRPASIPWKWITVALVILASLVFLVVFLMIKPRPSVQGEALRRQAADSARAVAMRDSIARTQRRTVALPPAETLAFAVPVRSLRTLDTAFLVSDSVEARGVRTMIAPLRLFNRPSQYRVYAGPYPSRARAEAATRPLSGTSLMRVTVVDSVPISLRLASGLTREVAVAERLRLRERRVPVFLIGRPDGTFQLYAGAYRAGVPRAYLQDLTTYTGSAGELVPRVGYLP